MILGTHNTMTYLKPKQWYLRPFAFLAKCQSVDYKTQAEKYGVKCFDIRIFWDEGCEIEYRHGIFRYDASNFEDLLKYCNENNMYVRLLFELRSITEKREDLNVLKILFKSVCYSLKETYPNIHFYGGTSTKDGELIYDFKTNINTIGLYASDTTFFPSIKSKFLRIIDDWCPKLYAWFKNKKNHQKYDEQYKNTDDVLLYDFIEIQ